MMEDWEVFHKYRSFLFAIAYRMLGTVTDAEDMVQETYLRWLQASKVIVKSPKAYLGKIVTRLCIDYLRSARLKREQYVGTWLPEPIFTEKTDKNSEPARLIELADSLSISFLVLLENLSPTERAVFLLREVFDYEYPEIAPIVGKTSTNCRQIMRRARKSISLQRSSHFDISLQQREQLTAQFIQAWTEGNLQGLLELLADDVQYCSDGGGKVTAAIKPLFGSVKVARFLIAMRQSNIIPNFETYLAEVNGESGIVNYVNNSLHNVICLGFVSDNRIQSIFAVVNPEKLKFFQKECF